MAGGSRKGQKEEAAARRQEMFALRVAGASYTQIGDHYGISSQAAFKQIKIVYNQIIEETNAAAREWQALECERLDVATRAIAAQVQAGDHQAIDRWVRLMERRARLLGLDAPVKTATAATISNPDGSNLFDAFSQKADKVYGDGRQEGQEDLIDSDD